MDDPRVPPPGMHQQPGQVQVVVQLPGAHPLTQDEAEELDKRREADPTLPQADEYVALDVTTSPGSVRVDPQTGVILLELVAAIDPRIVRKHPMMGLVVTPPDVAMREMVKSWRIPWHPSLRLLMRRDALNLASTTDADAEETAHAESSEVGAGQASRIPAGLGDWRKVAGMETDEGAEGA